MRQLVTFVITLDHGVRKTELKEYIKDSVLSWQGKLCPGTDDHDADPMWKNVLSVGAFKIRDLK